MFSPAGQVERERARPRRNRIGPLRFLSGHLRRLPDFIIIGVQKCGTTALYKYLEEHPDVLPALTKEIHFFDNNYHRRLTWYRAHFPASRFGAARGLTGEASPSYFLHPLAPARVSVSTPAARLVVVLRNPADRAYSHYQHNVRKGRERMTFEQAIEVEEKRLDGKIEQLLESVNYFVNYHQFSYLLRGIYAAQLQRWYACFAPERILVLDNRDLLTDPSPTFRRALEFLSLSVWEPEYRIHHHYGYSGIESSTRERLAAFFRPHNERLYELMGHDFGWDRRTT